MEQKFNDVNMILTPTEINEMEERRIVRLDEANIDEEFVIDQATLNFNNWNGYFNENIVRGKADVDFTFRDQWTVVERSEFQRLQKPPLMFNVLYDVVKKEVARNRRNRPDLMVRSLNGKASQEELSLRANLLRTIAYKSQNDLVYQTGFKSAISLGFGAFQIGVDYEGSRSFNKVIKYHIITDPTTCSWDPTALMPHKGDGNFCSRSFVLTRDEFFATYPFIQEPKSWIDPFMLLDYQAQTRDLIVLQDYYLKEWYPLIIYQLTNGMVVTKAQWDNLQSEFAKRREMARDAIVVGGIILNEIPQIKAERQTQDYRIMHYRLLRDQIIDFAEWKSRQLPIPFIDGDSYYIEGRQYTKSLIHEAKDAQKCLNYEKSEIVAEIKNRRREQWIATPDNIKGYEQQWRNPEVQIGALIAQPDPRSGAMPIKSPAWEISGALLENARASYQDILEIVGMTQGQEGQGRDISGKARKERKLESDEAAYVFFDNFKQALEQGGRITNDLLTYVIGNDERQMTINKRDGSSESIVLNQRKGDKLLNVLSEGEFDVEIAAGPDSATQKQIALEFFQETMAVANSPAFPLVADLWASNLDMEQMPQIKERFKTMVPANILAKEEGKEPPPPKPNPQEELAQAEIKSKLADVEAKQAKAQNEKQKLLLQEKELELEKIKIIMTARELDAQIKQDQRDHEMNLKQTEITHRGKLVDTLAGIHKHEQTIKSKIKEAIKE
jgi:hypothetical protein